MSAPSRSIRAVLFDLDDTLLDWSAQDRPFSDISRPHVNNMYDYLAGEGHLLPDRETFFQNYEAAIVGAWAEAKKTWAGVNFARTLQSCFVGLGLDVDCIDFEAVLRAYDWQTLPNVSAYPDAIPVLETLRRQGYKLGLITNSMMPMWMRDIELQAYGLLEYFEARITSGDTGYMKPHPAIYEYALDLLGSQPEQSLFVGDRPANDIAGANAAGLISVLMSPPHLNYELNGVQPDFTISSLSELPPLLADIQNNKKGSAA